MPLKMPVTFRLPPSISRGGAVCSGPDIEGIGKGCGSGGLASAAGLAAGVEVGALGESAGALCPKDGSAINATKNRTTKATNRIRKGDLLVESLVIS